LPGDIYAKKPDYNNILLQKDKGRGVKHQIGGYRFSEGKGMEVEDPAKKNFPGPGSYETKFVKGVTPEFSFKTNNTFDLKNL